MKTIAIAATLVALIVPANAGIMEYMAKTKPADKAVMAAILAIYDRECPGTMNEQFKNLKTLLTIEQAYSKKQALEAVKNQAAFFATAGAKAWCALVDERLAD